MDELSPSRDEQNKNIWKEPPTVEINLTIKRDRIPSLKLA